MSKIKKLLLAFGLSLAVLMGTMTPTVAPTAEAATCRYVYFQTYATAYAGIKPIYFRLRACDYGSYETVSSLLVSFDTTQFRAITNMRIQLFAGSTWVGTWGPYYQSAGYRYFTGRVNEPAKIRVYGTVDTMIGPDDYINVYKWF